MKRRALDRRGLFLVGGLVVAACIATVAVLRTPASARASNDPSTVAAPVSATASQFSGTVAAPSASKIASAPVADAIPGTAVTSAVVAERAPAGSAGMRIFKDPDSDAIGPPTAEATALEMEASSRDFSDLPQIRLADGSYMVDLQGRFQESMVMQIDANGRRVVSCVSDPKKAFEKAPVAAPQTPQREER